MASMAVLAGLGKKPEAAIPMKTPSHHRQREIKLALHERIGQWASRGQYRRALEMLDHVIEDSLPLFQGEDWVLKERRLAWLYRIEFLREWGKLTEAPAWACLEVEMDPQSVAAIAVKERLKREAGLLLRHNAASPTEANA